MKELYFYGAGYFGRKALEMLRESSLLDYEFKGYIETCPTDDYKDGYRVFDISNVSRNATIVITIEKGVDVLTVYSSLNGAGYASVYWFYAVVNNLEINDFFEDCCISCKSWERFDKNEILAQAEVHVCDFCNLNCRGCTHYSPIFERTYPDTEKRIGDIELISKKFPHLLKLYLLGGEPLLNPDIVEYVNRARALLPDTVLAIVTNGLLIPRMEEDFWIAVKNNNIIISITAYEPTQRILPEIERLFSKYKIKYNIRPEEKGEFNKPLSLNSDTKFEKMCISKGCVNIYNGKIARCPSLMYIDVLNRKFGVNYPEDGIIEINKYSSKEIISLLQRRVPLCDYCVKNTIKWESCGLKPKLEDFAE